MPITVTGSLNATGRKKFPGYRVVASYEVPVGDLAAAEGSAVGRGVAAVDPDGRFRIDLPTAAERKGPVTLTATSGAGLVAAEATLSEAQLEEPVTLEVAEPEAPTTVTESDDITLGARVTYVGRVIDASGRGAPTGIIVVLWGVPLGGAAEDAYPLDVPSTSGGGYFSGPWPDDELSAAFATVGGGDPIAITIDNSRRLPPRFVVVTPRLPEPRVGDGAGCVCDGPPRAPEAVDLANDAETYAADRGRCVDFTVPNRTLEEVAFQAVVRTTQPELRGMPPQAPGELPNALVTRLATLAQARAPLAIRPPARGGVDAVALPAPVASAADARLLASPRAVAGPSPIESVRQFAGERTTAVAVERARTLLGGVQLERLASATVLPEQVAELALNRRDLVANPIRLEASVLAELNRESTDLTPLRLLEAEQASAARRFRHQVGLLAAPNPSRFVLGDAHQADWDELPLAYQATTIAHGHLLTFKQVWRADGYSLGDLLYSLPLAPGQQKLISVLDWERRETDTRRARRTELEALDAELRHDRDISDVIRSALSERMDASSSASVQSVAAGFGGFIGPLVFGAAGGVSSAGSTAQQSSGRAVSGSALNQVRDRTLQAASVVRGQRSTVVQTSRQGESVRAQTEVVANYNHCHAMTVEYFEVLRHFQVRQELAHVQECLFVPFAVTPFSQSKALRWREPLGRALRRRDLRTAFRALERVATNWADADIPPGRFADEVVRHIDGELWMRIQLPRPADTADGGFDAGAWGSWTPWLWDTPQNIWARYLGVTTAPRRDAVWDRNIAPGVAQRIVDRLQLDLVPGAGAAFPVAVDTSLVSTFVQDRTLLVSMRVAPGALPGWSRAQVARLRLRAPAGMPGGSAVTVDTATFRYRTDHLVRDLVANRRVLNDLGTADDVEMLCPIDATERRNPREADRRTAEDLLDHLDEHIEYYHRAIWMQMDPNRRYLLLDGFVAPDAGGRSVASVVENRVIGVVGNSLVMPVAPGVRLDPTYEFAENSPEDLRHLYAGGSAPPMRISVPTRGVFADAVLGKCNSCEVIDDTRFWRFEEEPIPDAPTAIEPLSTNSRRRDPPGLAPDAFPDPVVRLQTAPPAPDPTGLAAAMRALGTTGIFKDITGLTLNQANSAQALKTAITTAQSFATQAGALAQQQYLNRELDGSLSRIREARDRQLITADEAQQLTESAIRGAVGEVRPQTAPATESAPVRRAMERVNTAANGGSLRVTRPEGAVEVRTGQAASPLTIDVAVDPEVPAVRQPSSMVCWAAAGTMMLSWRNRTSMTIESAMDSLGGGWRAAFDANRGLTLGELNGFARAVGLTQEGPASYTPEGLARLLDTHGPLWVVGDDSVEENMVVHARIVTAVRGDGRAEGTTVTLVDSSAGAVVTESFTDFARRLEASDAARFGAGIYHF